MSDIFGYDRKIKSTGEIASSEYAVVTVGGIQSLVQSVNVNYAQEVKTIYEVGNPNIYWVPGHASGTISCASLVGPGGFFAGWKTGKCGAISPLSVSVSSGGPCYNGSGKMFFDNGIIQSVSASITAGTMEITQSVNVMIGTLVA